MGQVSELVYRALVTWLGGWMVAFVATALDQKLIAKVARLATMLALAAIAASALGEFKAWWADAGQHLDKWEHILDKIPVIGR